MICLCCGRIIEMPDEQEKRYHWHGRCIRSFFGTSVFPEISIDGSAVDSQADDSTRKGITVPGVQKKISLHLERTRRQVPRLTIVDRPAGYILKPQTDEYLFLPEAEHLVMQMAEAAGIRTVPHALVISENDDERGMGFAYITKRVDRIAGRESGMLAMEDFCQLSGRLTEDKYKGSYENCARIIRTYSVWKGLDLTELFIRIVFCFITGNSDMHLKNFSLIEDAPGSRTFRLSPAYDLLPVNLLLPEDNDETALTLCGKRSRLKRAAFDAFADVCGIDQKTSDRLIHSITDKRAEYIDAITESFIGENMKSDFIDLLCGRIERLIHK